MKAFLFAISPLIIGIVSCDKHTISEVPVTNQHQKPEVLVRSAGYPTGISYYSLDLQLARNSSVSMKDGKYSIDSAFILANANRKALVQALSYDNLVEKTDVKKIPDFIKAFLDSLSDKKTFEIVNPNEEWQGDWLTLGKDVPLHQLVYFAEGKNVALLSFFTAAPAIHSQQIAIIKYQDKKIVDFWFETLPEQITKREQLIAHLIKDRRKTEGC